jgi:beta-glucanase (GH16 family)
MSTFWIYYQHLENSCEKKHDEVDILEPDPVQYYDASENVSGWWDETDTCTVHKYGQDTVRSTTPLFEDYHKYGLELFPDKIIFYFDDVPYFSADTISSPQYIHSLNMVPYLTLVMNVQMGDNPYPLPDAPFPEYMFIDYFRYYELKPDTVSQNILLQNFPNPFGNTTEIIYNILNTSSNVFINMYDVVGREIKSVYLTEKGKSKITLDCTGLSEGVYFCSLLVDDKVVDTKKMIKAK